MSTESVRNALKIAEASIPIVVALNLPDDNWYEIKLSVKKRPDETMLCRHVSVYRLLVDAEETPLEEEHYPVFKLNSSVSIGSIVLSNGVEHLVTKVDPRWGDKPWLECKKKRKDGTFGKARRHIYTNWELVKP